MGRKNASNTAVSVYVTAYEQLAVDYLRRAGYGVEFIPVSRNLYQRTPDILLNGIAWEIKTPLGNGSRTIENSIRSSKHQSPRLVLDIRFTKRIESQCIKEAKSRFRKVKKLEQLLLIRKNDTHLLLRRDDSN